MEIPLLAFPLCAHEERRRDTQNITALRPYVTTVPPLKLRSPVAKAAPIQAGRFPSPALAVRHGHSTGSAQLCHQHSSHAAGAARPPSPRLSGLQLLLGCPEAPPGQPRSSLEVGAREGSAFSPPQRFHPIGMPQYCGLLPILWAPPSPSTSPCNVGQTPRGSLWLVGRRAALQWLSPASPGARGVTPRGPPASWWIQTGTPPAVSFIPSPRGSRILQGTKGGIPLLFPRFSPAASDRISRLSPPLPRPPPPTSALGISAAPTSPAAPPPHPPRTLTQLRSEQTPRQAPITQPLQLPGAGTEVGGGEAAPGGRGLSGAGPGGRGGICGAEECGERRGGEGVRMGGKRWNRKGKRKRKRKGEEKEWNKRKERKKKRERKRKRMKEKEKE